MVEGGLVQLESENLLLNDRAAYDIAESMNPTVAIRGIVISSFARRAALRLIRHFQMKLDIFGRVRLAMDITQNDLEKLRYRFVWAHLNPPWLT
jgi:hypothetical protein